VSLQLRQGEQVRSSLPLPALQVGAGLYNRIIVLIQQRPGSLHYLAERDASDARNELLKNRETGELPNPPARNRRPVAPKFPVIAADFPFNGKDGMSKPLSTNAKRSGSRRNRLKKRKISLLMAR
jgi:hypothetical protein